MQSKTNNQKSKILLDFYRFFRFSAFGATAVLPLLGAASADRELTGREAARLLGVAAAFHAFAYVHNDVCDLELDRAQPLRAAYPLVRGAVSPRVALALALTCVPAAFVLDGIAADRQLRTDAGWNHRLGMLQNGPCALDKRAQKAGPPYPARRASRAARRAPSADGQAGWNHRLASVVGRRELLAAAFALLAAYNVWGKRCPFPPLTDLIQALGWAALLRYGAAATGRPPTSLTRLLVAYELALILMVNGVHGALRDLANDQAHGARTTAITLGAKVGVDGSLRASPALIGYALVLQAVLLALPLWGVVGKGAEGWTKVIGVGALTLGTLALLGAAATTQARPADVGMLHLMLLLSAPVALVAPGLRPAPRASLLLAHTVPLLANGMTYDALRWVLYQIALRIRHMH